MAAETWFNHDEAVDAGLADAVIDPTEKVDDPDASNRATKFSDAARTVLADVEQLIDRTEEVIAFRTDQGKPPLSDDSVETFAQLKAAHDRLTDVLTSEQPATTDPDIGAELLRFVKSAQGV